MPTHVSELLRQIGGGLVLLSVIALCFLVLGYFAAVVIARSTRSAPRVEQPQLKRVCANCKHFDLEEGQAAMAQFPSFQRVASAISPAQMNRRVVREFMRPCKMCNGTGKDSLVNADGETKCPGCGGAGEVADQELSDPGAPAKARWTEFGACLKDGVCVWGGDENKPCFEAKEIA